MAAALFFIFKDMAKKKNKTTSKTKQLEFKEVFLTKKMHGIIKGLELPKFYKDFTAREKLILYWHNPDNTKAFFKDVSFVGPRSLEAEKAKEQDPNINNDEEQQEETNDSSE